MTVPKFPLPEITECICTTFNRFFTMSFQTEVSESMTLQKPINQDISKTYIQFSTIFLFCCIILIRQMEIRESKVEYLSQRFIQNAIKYLRWKFLQKQLTAAEKPLKHVPAISYLFTKRQPFKNYLKCFLFNLKGYFRSRDIQIFVTFSLSFHIFQI